MAIKHFNEYYDKVYRQYKELKDVLADMSDEVNNGMLDPERLEQLKATILPVKTSFETLSYIKYLLNKPTRKSKHARYNNQSKKLIESSGNHKEKDITTKNEEVLSGLRNI